jgi:hypothetical protein
MAPRYLSLLEDFLKGAITPDVLRGMYIDAWIRDRDAEHDGEDPVTRKEMIELQSEVASGKITGVEFSDRFGKLLGISEISGKIADLINAFHSTVYLYTSNADDLREDPEFFIGLDELTHEARKTAAALNELLGGKYQEDKGVTH